MKGRFIAIEGTDGSGKTSQVNLLAAYFRRENIPFVVLKFPRYGTPAAYFVEKYLRGDYGDVGEWGPEPSSLFYALDRFDAAPEIRRALRSGKTVLADRYFFSNLGHQGGKIRDMRKRKAFMQWLHTLEFNAFKIPKPDVNIFLDVPPKDAFRFVQSRIKNAKKRDIHERSLSYLAKSYEAYHTAIAMFPREFKVIECAPKGTLLGIPDVHSLVVNSLKKT